MTNAGGAEVNNRSFNSALRPLLLLALGMVFAISGCGPGRTAQSFIPAEDVAQATLDNALAAWVGGKAPGLMREAGPAIQLVDSTCKPGQKLTAFTILGPTSGDADRCYAVRLTFDQPREEIRARYVVYGLDPLWVLRYEDFEMTMHWCPPADRTTRKPESGS
jgi:hypothetical protein